jgi:hypothetical protein
MGDNFLSMIVPEIMASQAYKNNGAIVIWFDETEGGNTTQYTVPEIVISPLAKGNAYNSTLAYTHSSDLKSMQELFGVSAPGGGFLGDANTAGTNDLWDLFKFSPTITSTASPGVAPLSPTGATLSDSAVLANGHNETGSLFFTLTGPNGFSYMQTDPVSGNNTYSASVTLPSTGTVPGTYTWSVSFAGDANNFAATDQGGTAEQTVVVGPGATIVNNALYLVGGNTNDQLNVTPIGASQTGSTGINVNGNLDNLNINQNFTGVTTIYVTDFGGNDNFQFAPSLTLATVISAGDGKDNVQLGNGANSVTLGNGNDNIQAGDGNNIGDGNNDSVSVTGNGNDFVQVGDGNNDSVSVTGNGNDSVQIGNGLGDFVSLVGDGNDDLQTGTGSGEAHVAGSGHKNVHLGSSDWQLI